MGDYLHQTRSSYPMLESPSTTGESSANMASQEYSGENADLYFPIESSWLDSFPEPYDLEPYPEQYLPLMSCDTNHSFNDESQFLEESEDFEPYYNYLPLENSPPEDTASRAGSTK